MPIILIIPYNCFERWATKPRQFVLLKDVNAITEVTPIKDSYKTTDVGDSINGALNPSVTLGWQDQCGPCFESSVANHVKLFCSDINAIAEFTSIKDSYKTNVWGRIMDVHDNINVFGYGFSYLSIFFKLFYLLEGLLARYWKGER